MSRGLGATQRRIMDHLAEQADRYYWVAVADLARALQIDGNQARIAVRGLERRSLVVVTREHIGWREGIGRLAYRNRGSEQPVVLTVRKGEQWPLNEDWIAARDVEFYRVGTPISGLAVWLPQSHLHHALGRWESTLRIGARLGFPPRVSDYESIAEVCRRNGAEPPPRPERLRDG